MSRIVAQAVRSQLGGTPIAPADGPSRCRVCRVHLLEGATVTAVASRFTDEPAFTLARLACASCGNHRVRAPTLGPWR